MAGTALLHRLLLFHALGTNWFLMRFAHLLFFSGKGDVRAYHDWVTPLKAGWLITGIHDEAGIQGRTGNNERAGGTAC